jgi:hypothetical protein
MANVPEELYREREKRVNDAIQMKVPDRVPIWFQDLGFFPAKYSAMTSEEAMYDEEKLLKAYKKVITDLEPDMYFNPGHSIPTSGDTVEAVECRQVKWPGHGVSPNHGFQFVEGEYMKAEEYDAFLQDPTDFTIRTYLPRVLGTFGSIEKLPPITGFLHGFYGMPLSGAYVTPEVVKAFESFYKAGLATLRYNANVASFWQEMKGLGFPVSCGSVTLAPFDLLSDTLRGMRGAMLDMYRQPEKLLAVIEKILPMMIGAAIAAARMNGIRGVFIPLHRGAHGFMSLEQFETFYWDSLKRLLLGLINEGLTPYVFFEGDYTSRLAYLAELPRGKVLGLFDSTDMYRAKEMLGKNMCISGMMPVSLLQIGTDQMIQDYAKKLIDVVGKDGGFIMGPRSTMEECDPERVKVWVKFTKEYGIYA